MIGRVLTVAGSQMTVGLDRAEGNGGPVRVGSVVKSPNGKRDVIAGISEVQAYGAGAAGELLTVDLLGELALNDSGELQFSRGVSIHPAAGEPVFAAEDKDLRAIYGQPGRPSVSVGTLYYDPGQPAYLLTDELLGKHFAVLGTTGAGKSCGVTVILSAILEKHPHAHVILLDPHNEYGSAFGDLAEKIDVDNLRLPLWVFSFEEASQVLIRTGSEEEQESQAFILKDAITWARRNYSGSEFAKAMISVDTPTPYRLHELLRFINDQMGRLGKADTAKPYLRLREHIESLRDDRRYDFLFSSEDDILVDIVSRLMRVPVKGKPITIVDLSGVPSQVADVIVSTLSRIIFDFAVWCEPDRRPPVLLACEEAHRYVPADERRGFASTVRVITQIAKEGRKYGISLALITQRPTELSLAALSQCGTIFALRLGSEVDQEFIGRTLPDVAREMLPTLSSLPTQQAIVSGEAVRVPVRIRFNDLPEDRRPHSASAAFAQKWQTDDVDRRLIERGIRRWRSQIRN
ncbi:MAG: DUF87 domain-containing protein [Candidatus Cybelea sp.]